MNPYATFSELLFTCVNAPKAEVVNEILRAFNRPAASDVEQALMAGAKEVHVFKGGVPMVYRHGDPMPPRDTSIQYFAKESPLDFSLAYIDRVETDTTKEHRSLLWEPRIRPGTTVYMASLGVASAPFSEGSSHIWIDVRIYDDHDYPGCFFEYFADFSRIHRTIMANKDDEGWDALQHGPVQPFENPAYYTRRLKKDRLTKEIITEYMEKLGFFIAEDGFWETAKPATFLWQVRPDVQV